MYRNMCRVTPRGFHIGTTGLPRGTVPQRQRGPGRVPFVGVSVGRPVERSRPPVFHLQVSIAVSEDESNKQLCKPLRDQMESTRMDFAGSKNIKPATDPFPLVEFPE